MFLRRSRQPDDRSESGTMAVEFALVMPVLILFVGACIQFGTIYYVHQRMENTARQVLQMMVAQDLPALPNEITCLNLITATVNAEKTTCDLLSSLSALNMGFKVTAVQPDPNDPVNRDVSLTITVPMKDAALIDVLGLFGTEKLQTKVTMRKVEL